MIHQSFNPRTYIRYDVSNGADIANRPGFNPRTYIRYDLILPRVGQIKIGFNPRTYIRYDHSQPGQKYGYNSFNPRTYIRYDLPTRFIKGATRFQSTYLYKVRPERLAQKTVVQSVSIHVPI